MSSPHRDIIFLTVCLVSLTLAATIRPASADSTGLLELSNKNDIKTLNNSIALDGTNTTKREEDEFEEDDENDLEDDEADDEDDEDDEDEDDSGPLITNSTALTRAASWFGRLIRLRNGTAAAANNTIAGHTKAVARSQKSEARGLGLLALMLGPLIGLTLGKALLRGLIWALIAYGMHLFFPGILSVLGLGTGLVGFARQMRPDYAEMIVHTLINLHDEFHRLPPIPVQQQGPYLVPGRH